MITIFESTMKPVLAQMIAMSSQLGSPWLAELYRAVAGNRLVLIHFELTSTEMEASEYLEYAESLGRPVLAFIGDDDERDTGPAGWPCARNIMAWANFVIVQGCAGNAETYRDIAAATELFGRAMVIESSGQMAVAWGRAAVKAERRHVVMMPVDDAAAVAEVAQ